jgi:2,5-diamino-6-(ribosylamino)-4(3H)-pyrimidinone 5'-phosphate reductase
VLPRVIIHNVVSADGRVGGFTPDLGQYYELAATWNEDATLAGSVTISVPAEEMPTDDAVTSDPPAVGWHDTRPLLVVPDSRGRVRHWEALRRWPYWRGFVALCSRCTPGEYLEFLHGVDVDCILAGDDHVDLRRALVELRRRYDVKVIRVDSGGTLNGVLLRAGLVDEVSLLVFPALVGGSTERSVFRAPDPASPDDAIKLRLLHSKRLRHGSVWLRYEVLK